MKTCKRCGEVKPLDQFFRCSRVKDGRQAQCKTCKILVQRLSPKRKQAVSRYYKSHRQECIDRDIKRQQRNPELHSAVVRKWRKENRERHLAYRRNYYARNAAIEIERVRRRMERIKGTPWLAIADMAEIDGIYLFCRIFPGFEVDHVIPLNGKTVSGLHVPWNLQPLPVTTNRKKGNKFVENHANRA